MNNCSLYLSEMTINMSYMTMIAKAYFCQSIANLQQRQFLTVITC
jgi:hypothetical protein